MKCRLCEGEIKNERYLPQHFGVEQPKDPNDKNNPGLCPKLQIAKNKQDLESLMAAVRDFGCKGGSTNTLISRALQTGMVDETVAILSVGKMTTPRVDPDAVISLLGSIQSQQTKDAAPEGFIEEYKEAARRLQK